MTPALALLALTAALGQAGPSAPPEAQDAALEDRAAAAATWIGAVSPEDVLSVSLADPDWWVLNACGGATVVIDVLPAGAGIVEAVLLDAERTPVARARSAEGGGRLHWIASRSGRLYLRVTPAPDTGAPRSEYRLRAWWADALTCPGPTGTPPSEAPSTTPLPPMPPPLPPGPPATETATTTPPSFAPATPENPSPSPAPDQPVPASPAPPVSSVPGVPPGERAAEPTPPGVHEHDGFLWRFALGLGYAEREYFDDRENSYWTGTGSGGLNMAFGGSVNETFYLFFDLNANFPQLFGIGAGFGAYLGDNWFLDAAIGYHLFENGYLTATFGKEWWVGEQWLTGVSVRWMGGTGWAFEEDGWITSVTLNWSLTCN